jgi:hypothetical protein
MMTTRTNTDPEAEIEEIVSELAYKRVKESYLFNVLSNEQVDQKARELAEKITGLIETWISTEVGVEAMRQAEMDEFVGDVRRSLRK